MQQKQATKSSTHLVHNAQEGLHADHVGHVRDGVHIDQKPLQFEAPVLDEGQVRVVCKLLQGLLGQRREHVAQVVALHVLLDLRVQLGELAEASEGRRTKGKGGEVSAGIRNAAVKA